MRLRSIVAVLRRGRDGGHHLLLRPGQGAALVHDREVVRAPRRGDAGVGAHEPGQVGHKAEVVEAACAGVGRHPESQLICGDQLDPRVAGPGLAHASIIREGRLE